VLHSGHGEFPRIVLAPGTLEEAFALGKQAFELADRFQVPVFLLTDQYFVDTYYNMHEPELETVNPRQYVADSDDGYQRYKLTDSGVSPRAVPGFGDGVVVVSGNEHLEDGHITEDPDIRNRMNRKRLDKVHLLSDASIPPTITGGPEGKTMVVCWGSLGPAVQEAMGRMKATAPVVHFSQVFPLQPEAVRTLEQAKRIVVVEQNATGQFARLLRGYYGITGTESVLKYNGRPFSVEELVAELTARLAGGEA